MRRYRVCRGLRGTMSRVIFNPYGSHVLEALFGFIPRLVNASMDEIAGGGDADAEQDEEEEAENISGELEPLEKLFQETCDELSGGWMEIMMDARGSHVRSPPFPLGSAVLCRRRGFERVEDRSYWR